MWIVCIQLSNEFLKHIIYKIKSLASLRPPFWFKEWLLGDVKRKIQVYSHVTILVLAFHLFNPGRKVSARSSKL